MGLSYYDVERKPRTFLAKLWMILNAIIALGMAFYWSGLALYVAEPFRWAMRDGVSSFPTLFEFPYLLGLAGAVVVAEFVQFHVVHSLSLLSRRFTEARFHTAERARCNLYRPNGGARSSARQAR